jgi:hypothetical protein
VVVGADRDGGGRLVAHGWARPKVEDGAHDHWLIGERRGGKSSNVEESKEDGRECKARKRSGGGLL